MKPIVVVISLLLLASASPGQTCPCDCNEDRQVRVNELTTAVGVSLARFGMERCPAADGDDSSSIEVNELVSGVGAALHGCPQPTPAATPTPTANFTAAELAAARALWRQQGLFHYRYHYTLGCFCPGPHQTVIDVFDDRLAGFRDPESGNPVPPPDYLDFYFTVDGLFDYLEQSLGQADVIQVEFDSAMGYPAAVFIDRYRQAVDDELWIDIKDVEPLQMAGVCRTENDCDVSFEICIPPGGFAGCGVCLDHQAECERDSDCEGGNVCKPVGYDAQTCACDPSVLVCAPGCDDDDDCDAGQTCGEDRRCAPTLCRTPDRPWADDPCPAMFTCTPATASPGIPSPGECRRTACASDSDCDERIGLCVNGECYVGPGRCDVIPP